MKANKAPFEMFLEVPAEKTAQAPVTNLYGPAVSGVSVYIVDPANLPLCSSCGRTITFRGQVYARKNVFATSGLYFRHGGCHHKHVNQWYGKWVIMKTARPPATAVQDMSEEDFTF